MQLTKPFDKDALVSALKAAGIAEAEVVAKSAINVTADWLKSSISASDSGILGHVEQLALPVIDLFVNFANSKLDALVAPAPAAPVEPAPVAAPIETPAAHSA